MNRAHATVALPVLLTMLTSTAHAAPAQASAGGDDGQRLDEGHLRDRDARDAYDRGKRHYELAEWDEAARAFREAYRLRPAPALLFDVAQAERRRGDCRAAIEAYSTFVRLAPEHPRVPLADRHVADLQPNCAERLPSAAPPAAIAPVPSSARDDAAPTIVAPAVTATVTAPRGVTLPRDVPPGTSNRRLAWVPAVGAAAGLVLGATAAGLTWSAQSRYSEWQAEDANLRNDAGQIEWEESVRRTNANDERLRSIDGLERAAIAAAVAGGVALIASAVVWFRTRR